MSYDLIESTLIRLGEQMPERLSPSLGYGGTSSSNAERYLNRVEDCCRRAVIAEDVDQCSHWPEAAARWFSLAREQASPSFSAQAASRLSFSSAS
jgi:hypothetical protein